MVNNSNPFLDDDEKEKEDDQDSFLEFLSKSKSFTPFDKALKGLVIDALGGEEEDKKEKGGSSIKIVDGQEYLSEDVRPEQADILGGKTASEMEFTPEYRTEFEKRQKEREGERKERDRERARERERDIYIYIYIYIQSERETEMRR